MTHLSEKQDARLTCAPDPRSQVSLTGPKTRRIALTSEPEPTLTSEPTIYILGASA